MSVLKPRIYHQPKQPLQEVLPLDTPFSVHLDVCSSCNFKCTFCFQHDKDGMNEAGVKWGFMSVDTFKQCVDDLKKFPSRIKKIKIGNHGEPTLHPALPELIKYAHDSGVADTIEMFTNGSKLEPVLNQAIIDAGLQRINISIEGLTRESYKRIAGVDIDYEKFIANIADLYQRKSSYLSMYIKVVDHAVVKDEPGRPTIDLSQEDKQYFYDLYGSISDEMSVENVVPQWAETDQNDLTSVGMYGQKIDKFKKICPFPFMYLHVNSDGTVAGCTLDWARKVIVGDLESTPSLVDIWNGPGMRDLRLKLIRGEREQIPMCNTCNAPNVCVIENLDPYSEQLLEIYSS